MRQRTVVRASTKGLYEGDKRETIVVREKQFKKIKDHAKKNGRYIKDVVSEAFGHYLKLINISTMQKKEADAEVIVLGGAYEAKKTHTKRVVSGGGRSLKALSKTHGR